MSRDIRLLCDELRHHHLHWCRRVPRLQRSERISVYRSLGNLMRVAQFWAGWAAAGPVRDLGTGQKIRNLERDPRAFSVEGTDIQPPGLQQYLVVHATARITEGGGPQLLQELARTYLGPDVKFPPYDDPPPGRIVHITVERVGGVGPWVTTD